jgi:hypothetical protein
MTKNPVKRFSILLGARRAAKSFAQVEAVLQGMPISQTTRSLAAPRKNAASKNILLAGRPALPGTYLLDLAAASPSPT